MLMKNVECVQVDSCTEKERFVNVPEFPEWRDVVRYLRNPVIIVLFGMAFRILLIMPVLDWLGTPADHFLRNEPSHIAAHLLRGDGFASPYTDLPIPTAQQPPLYPLFVAGIFRLFGAFSKASLYLILFANCIAGGLTIFLIYQAGIKYLSPFVGSLSGWAWAIFPPIAVTDITLSSYAFATLAVVLWLHCIPTLVPRIRNWILVGVATGFMLLLNPMLVLLVPASALWLNKKQAFVLLSVAFLCIAPWYVRNYRTMGHFYPALRDNFGMELYFGNHRGMIGSYDYGTGESPYGTELPKVGEAHFFEARRREAISYIKSAPVDFIRRSVERSVRFWFAPWPVAYVTLLVLAVWRIRFAPSSLAVFSATLFVFYPLVFYVTQTSWPGAYRHPIEPMIILMAAQSVSSFVRTRETAVPDTTEMV